MSKTGTDLTNQRFGLLTAIAPTGERRNGSPLWHCICDCGNEKDVAAKNLIGGSTRSCGCLRLGRPYKLGDNDLTGQRFGRLTVIESTAGRTFGSRIWRCRCDCGNIKDVSANNLRKGDVKSCGCLLRENCGRPKGSKNSQKSDLTGQRFGKLIAIEPTGERRNGSPLWHCICDCGNEKDVAAKNLISGNTKSCGCLRLGRPYKLGDNDLTGQRFGRLTVIESTAGRTFGSRIWRCRCDCGNIKDVSANNLRKGDVKSCGCILRESNWDKGGGRPKGSKNSQERDLTGQRFGKLIAIEPTGEIQSGSPLWRCRCDCGNEKITTAFCLIYGRTKYCTACGRKSISEFMKAKCVEENGND